MPILLNKASATGSAATWRGGRGVFTAVATWNGGNIALQYLGPDNTTWLDVGTALTANGMSTFELPPGQIRAAVTTATAAYAQAEESEK